MCMCVSERERERQTDRHGSGRFRRDSVNDTQPLYLRVCDKWGVELKLVKHNFCDA